jgi:hypothetical protein
MATLTFLTTYEENVQINTKYMSKLPGTPFLVEVKQKARRDAK